MSGLPAPNKVVKTFCRVAAVSVLVLFGASVAVTAQDGFGQRDQASVDAVESLNAYAAYKLGDYETARERWLVLAERGNTSAMINIANMYEQGQGVDRDLETALAWQRKAADLGDSRAQLHLGLAYEKGLGVKRDPQRAAEWFRKSAEQNDSTAQFNLAVMLATAYGAGLDQSSAAQREEAADWLQRAADGGHPDAANFLATLQKRDEQPETGPEKGASH